MHEAYFVALFSDRELVACHTTWQSRKGGSHVVPSKMCISRPHGLGERSQTGRHGTALRSNCL